MPTIHTVILMAKGANDRFADCPEMHNLRNHCAITGKTNQGGPDSPRVLANQIRIITLRCSVAYQEKSSQGTLMGGLYAYSKVSSG